jgi:hypothetical protein
MINTPCPGDANSIGFMVLFSSLSILSRVDILGMGCLARTGEQLSGIVSSSCGIFSSGMF